MYSGKREESKAVLKVTSATKKLQKLAANILDITNDSFMTDKEKILRIQNQVTAVLEGQEDNFAQKLDAVHNNAQSAVNQLDVFDFYEKVSKKTQQKLSTTVKALVFDEKHCVQPLYDAVVAYQQNDAPNLEFLSKKERQAVENNGHFRMSLYKILLFKALQRAIKGGKMNLKNSFRYRAFESYLIPEEANVNKFASMLEKHGLKHLQDFNQVISLLKPVLDEQFISINENDRAGLNGYLKVTEKGIIDVKTPAIENRDFKFITQLLEQESSIPVLQILRDIEKECEFLQCLSHHSRQHAKFDSNPEIAYAGIMALGCNIGPRKMVGVSNGVTESPLLDMITHRFSIENLRQINDRIVQKIDELPLSNVYKIEGGRIYSSSDGKKVTVAVDSLLASLSFKYYGRDRGVALYNFTDEKQRMFYSTVFSSSEREATYVVDGLLHNSTPLNRIHCTDTHGYTEAVFGLTHLLGFSFAPRIRKVEQQTLHSLHPRSRYKNKGYRILPSRAIALKDIEAVWHEILRVLISVKSGHTSASQLFSRLNSYSADHPVYTGLKEFGRIAKTLFLLKYFDCVTTRQRIQRQLNLVELSNKFHDAVFWAREKRFHVGTYDEQMQYTLCRSIIQNAIILWNYLSLSMIVVDCPDEEVQQDILEQISRGSVLTWKHVNFSGEYDFTQHVPVDSPFNMTRILNLKVGNINRENDV